MPSRPASAGDTHGSSSTLLRTRSARLGAVERVDDELEAQLREWKKTLEETHPTGEKDAAQSSSDEKEWNEEDRPEEDSLEEENPPTVGTNISIRTLKQRREVSERRAMIQKIDGLRSAVASKLREEQLAQQVAVESKRRAVEAQKECERLSIELETASASGSAERIRHFRHLYHTAVTDATMAWEQARNDQEKWETTRDALAKVEGERLKWADAEEEVKKVEAEERAERLLEAQRLAALERAASKQRSRIRKGAQKAAKEREKALQQVAEQQIASAKRGRAAAKARLRERAQANRERQEKAQRVEEMAKERRMQAILSLRDNSERAARERREELARKERKAQRRALEKKKEMEAIAATGRNPHEALRQRAYERRWKRLEKEKEQERIARELETTKKMLEEERKRELALEKQRESILSLSKEQSLSKERSISPPPILSQKEKKKLPKLPMHERLAVEKLDAFDPSASQTSKKPKSRTLDPLDEEDGVVQEDMAEPEFGGLWSNEMDASFEALPEQAWSAEKKTKKKKKKSALTRLEHVIHARAKHKQVAPAKAAFLASPTQVRFEDFRVGEAYHLTFTLTNVSLSVNAFRMLPLPSMLAEFLDVVYTPAGNLSPGMQVSIHVTFHPKLNEDLRSEIPFLSETGPFSVPVVCLRQRCQVEVDTQEIHVGNVVRGDEGFGVLHITNKGVLSTTCKVIGEGVEGDFEGEEHLAALSFARTLEIPAHSDAPLNVVYQPVHVGVFSFCFTLQFADEEIKDIPIRIMGQGCDVAVYGERETLDMRVCCFGASYRDTLVLHNRGAIVRKFKVIPPPELDGFLEASPKTAHVQAGESFAIQLKLTPEEGILEQCGRYGHPETGIMEVPVEVQVSKQKLGVTFTIRAKITSNDIVMEPTQLGFGRCSIRESVSQTLVLKNAGILPQKFGFSLVRKAQEEQIMGNSTLLDGKGIITVYPGDGCGALMPKESLTLTVVYSPDVPGPDAFDLVCTNLPGRKFTIPCTGEAFVPPVQFSSSKIHMAATALGDTTVASVFLKNTFVQPVEYELRSPIPKRLRICPRVGRLEANSMIRIQLSFTPQYGEVEKTKIEPAKEEIEEEVDPKKKGKSAPKKSRKKKPPRKKSSKKEPVVEVVEKEPEPVADPIQRGNSLLRLQQILSRVGGGRWSEQGAWHIPCFVRIPPDVAEKAAREAKSMGDAAGSLQLRRKAAAAAKAGNMVHIVHLEVNTCAILPSLVPASGDMHPIVDFGRVGVGCSVTKSITIQNISDTIMRLEATALDPAGPFVRLNALRDMQAKGTHDILFTFTPQDEQIYFERLTISAGGNIKLAIRLQGLCVRPALRILPESQRLDLGDILVGSTVRKPFQLCCDSKEFPLRYVLRVSGRRSLNAHGNPVFDVVPVEGMVPPQEQQEVNIVFCADRPGGFSQCFAITTPQDEKQHHEVHVRARAWLHSMFVFVEDGWAEEKGESALAKDNVVDGELMVPGRFTQHRKKDNTDLTSLVGSRGVQGNSTNPHRITLHFDAYIGGPVVEASLFVGNFREGKGSSGEFSLEDGGLPDAVVRDGFELDGSGRVSVEPGSKKSVKIRFVGATQSKGGDMGSRTSRMTSRMALMSSRRGNGPAQRRVHVVKGLLKGGSPSPEGGIGYVMVCLVARVWRTPAMGRKKE